MSSGMQTKVMDKSLVNSLEGTVVWNYDSMAYPQIVVKLYKVNTHYSVQKTDLCIGRQYHVGGA